MNKLPLRAGIIGASGYTGRELVTLLARHPRLEPAWATSEAEAGQRVPGTRELVYERSAEVDVGGVDIVFSCLPTGESGGWALRALDSGVAAIDLSADLRPSLDRAQLALTSAGAAYASDDGAAPWLGTPARETGTNATARSSGAAAAAVYGLPELWRDEIVGARLVANPGCYPTGVLLCLSPLFAARLVDPDRPTIVDAASGVTGAGRSARRDLLFGEVAEDYRAYGLGNEHRHVPELAAGLARATGGPVPDFVFTPHLLPVRRGILETIHVPLRPDASAHDVREALIEAYEGEPFIEVLSASTPSLATVVGRNVVAIGVSAVAHLSVPVATCVVALDNLLKGAAGQALQNANLMLGLSETEGLPC